MTLTTRIATTTTATASKTIGTAGALSTSSNSLNVSHVTALASGTGTGKADLIYQDRRTLTASASENIDLAGILVGPLGDVLTFANVKVLRVVAAVGNVNDVVVGGAATNAFVGPFGASTHTHAVRPDGKYEAIDPKLGWTVTAGTGDILKIANGGSGTPVTYDIYIVGASA